MSEKKCIYAALLGAGTVGGGVYRLAKKMKKEIPLRVGSELVIKKVLVKDASKHREGIDNDVLTDNWGEIINDPDIQIVIELMGGTGIARTRILEALRAGKHVVTANKDLLAEYGEEIFSAARENNCDIQFEAAVAGAIPIIRPLMQNMAGDNITGIMGIVNGTTNYILTKMTEEKKGYHDALAVAQRKGYAESDPSSDVDGLDAARKMAIIAQLIYHTNVTLQDVYKEGITSVMPDDIRYAGELGYVIKLVGVVKMTDGKVEVHVNPMLLEKDHPLATVRNSFNAIFVKGEAMDEAMFMGRGAGSLPTASAVLGDVMDVMRNIRLGCCNRVPVENYRDTPVLQIDEIKSKYFIRMKVEDRPGVLAEIAVVLGENAVGIANVSQKDTADGVADLLFIIEEVEEAHMVEACEAMRSLDCVYSIASIIRVN